MRLVKSSVELVPQQPGVIGAFKQAELGGRLCYKSEDKIDENSWKRMIDIFREREHYSPLAHGTIYLTVADRDVSKELFREIATFYTENHWSRCHIMRDIDNNEALLLITTNLRVIIENARESDLAWFVEPTRWHDKRFTFKVICDRGVSAEANRHTANSICEQSTRYCNYQKDKFGSEITIIQPQDMDDFEVTEFNNYYGDSAFQKMCEEINTSKEFKAIDYWMFANLASEWAYMNLIRLGFKPQEARRILPLDLKTEVMYTAYKSDWEHFIKLRTAAGAHPDIRPIAEEIKRLLEPDENISNNL